MRQSKERQEQKEILGKLDHMREELSGRKQE
jgi:hypothetical protein